MATKKFGAKITVKGVMSSATNIEVFANNPFDAKKLIIAQYANGDDKKISWFKSPYEIK